MSIRVLLADDHKIIRDGLRSLLDRQADIEVIGEVDNGRDAVSSASDLRPDIVVMDISMRDLNGIDATRQLLEQCPHTSVIALSMHSRGQYVSAMLAAGARGYVLKNSTFKELAEAIRVVHSGRVYLSPDVADVVVDDLVRRMGSDGDNAPGPASVLSPREREVLQLIGEGNSTKEIATQLGLSVKTVETHRRQVMERLGIFTVAGLVKYAVREGLISIDE